MNDLITLEEYKTAKGIGGTTNDDKLELLIPAVSNLIQAYIGYSIAEEHEVEEVIVSPFSTNIIHLNGYPVNEIVSVEEAAGYLGYPYDSTVRYIPVVEGSGYRYNPSTGGLIRNYGEWSEEVKVTYSTGYGDGETPKELKLAAIAMVDYYLKEQYIQSKSLMGASTTNVVSNEIPPHIKLILDTMKY